MSGLFFGSYKEAFEYGYNMYMWGSYTRNEREEFGCTLRAKRNGRRYAESWLRDILPELRVPQTLEMMVIESRNSDKSCVNKPIFKQFSEIECVKNAR